MRPPSAPAGAGLLILAACLSSCGRGPPGLVLTGRVLRGDPPVPVVATVKAAGMIGVARGGGFAMRGRPTGRTADVEILSVGLPPARFPGVRLPASGSLDLGDFLIGPDQEVVATVVDLAGRPLEGAAVDVFPEWRPADRWWEGRYPWEDRPGPAFSGRTGPDGVARFPEVPPGDWAFMVNAKGFARRVQLFEVREGRAAAPRFVLEPGCSLAGTLLGPGAEPRAGAVLYAGSPFLSEPHPLAHARAVTDGEGRFSIEGLPAGPVRLRLSGEGHLRDLEDVVVPGVGEATIRVEGAALLAGRVVDGEEGGPVEGAEVSAMVRAGIGLFDYVRTRTDREGRYSVAGLAPGTLERLSIEKDGHLPSTEVDAPADSRALRDGRTEIVDASLRRGLATLLGRVLDGWRRGVPWVRVDVGVGRGGRSLAARTDAYGEFLLEGLGPGTVRFEVRADGWEPAARMGDGGRRAPGRSESLEVPDRGVVRKVLRLVRTPGKVRRRRDPPGSIRIAGRIVDEEGKPVPGADLRLVGTTEPVPAWVLQRQLVGAEPVVVDGEGRFAVEGLRPSDFAMGTREPGQPADATWLESRAGACLVARAPGKSPLVLPLRDRVPGGREGDRLLRLEADPGLAGRVVDPEGRPVPGARIDATWIPPRDEATARIPAYRGPARAVADKDGRFRIPGLDATAWRIAARAPGFLDGGGFPAAPGDPGVTIRLERPSPIEGTLADPGGAPVEGVLVEGTLSRSMSSLDPRPSSRSDDRGRFRLDCLPGEEYEVRVRSSVERNFLPEVLHRVPAGTAQLRLVLSPGLLVAGTLLDADGRPVGGGSLQAVPESPARREGLHYWGGETDREGRFRIPGLPPGKCVLSQPHGTGWIPEVPFDPVTVEAGRVDVVIRGRSR